MKPVVQVLISHHIDPGKKKQRKGEIWTQHFIILEFLRRGMTIAKSSSDSEM